MQRPSPADVGIVCSHTPRGQRSVRRHRRRRRARASASCCRARPRRGGTCRGRSRRRRASPCRPGRCRRSGARPASTWSRAARPSTCHSTRPGHAADAGLASRARGPQAACPRGATSTGADGALPSTSRSAPSSPSSRSWLCGSGPGHARRRHVEHLPTRSFQSACEPRQPPCRAAVVEVARPAPSVVRSIPFGGVADERVLRRRATGRRTRATPRPRRRGTPRRATTGSSQRSRRGSQTSSAHAIAGRERGQARRRAGSRRRSAARGSGCRPARPSVASAPIGSAIRPANAAAATPSVRQRGRGAPLAEPGREADEQRRQREQQPALDEPVGVPGREDADLDARPRPRA